MKPFFFITRNFPPDFGGIESMAWEILSDAVQKFPGRIWLIHFGPHRANRMPRELGRYIYVPSWGMASTILTSALTGFFLGLAFRPEIIVNMQVTTAFGTCLAGRIFGIPQRIIALGLEVMPWPQQSFERIKKICFTSADRIIAISHFTHTLVEGYQVNQQKLRILPPGIRPEKFPRASVKNKSLFEPKLNSQHFICLFTGRLVPRKGVDKCLEALKLLNDPNIILVIAGEGSDKSRLQKITKKLGLQSQVIFTGELPENLLPDYYANADVFVMPSRTLKSPPECEGFGIVYLEASSAGIPCIGSTEGGVPDAVEHGFNGYNPDPHDEKTIASYIKNIKLDPALQERMGSNGRKRVLNEFDWKDLSPKYTQVLFNHDP